MSNTVRPTANPVGIFITNPSEDHEKRPGLSSGLFEAAGVVLGWTGPQLCPPLKIMFFF